MSSSEEEDSVCKLRKRRPRKQKTIPFTSKLVTLFREEPDLIKWENGDIVIPEPRLLEKQLARYFRSGHYTSFQRQLNNFGYNKIDKTSGPKNSRYVKVKGEAMDCAEDILKLRPIVPPRRKPSKSPPDDSCDEPPESSPPNGDEDDERGDAAEIAVQRDSAEDGPPSSTVALQPRDPTRRCHVQDVARPTYDFGPVRWCRREETTVVVIPPREAWMPRDGDFPLDALPPMKSIEPSYRVPIECRDQSEKAEVPTPPSDLFKKEFFISGLQSDCRISDDASKLVLRFSTVCDGTGFPCDLEPLPAPIPPSDDDDDEPYYSAPTISAATQRRKRSRASFSARRLAMAGKNKRFCNAQQQPSHRSQRPPYSLPDQHSFSHHQSELGAHADSLFATENLGDSIDSFRAATNTLLRESFQSDSVFGIEDIHTLQNIFVADDAEADTVLYDADAVLAC